MDVSDLYDAPLEVLRSYTAGQICLMEPKALKARGVKDEAKRVLTMYVTWKEGLTMFQMTIPRNRLERVLSRWVWDGWTVEVMPELRR